QLKLKTCLSRLRLATTVTLHDVSDAFMKFRVSSALGSFFQFYWRNGYYQFSRMIYGSSIAPSCLEGGMGHVEQHLLPTVERPLPLPNLDTAGSLDLYVDHVLDSDRDEPDQCSFMDDILDFTQPTEEPAPLIDKYTAHDLPLKTQALSDASADHPIPVLGLELVDSGDSLRYPPKAIATVLAWPLDHPLTYTDSLSLL
ncbi:hypothetical protein FOZ62_019085, partial [Perkinsus olseni]